jgi:hypothetical protein
MLVQGWEGAHSALFQRCGGCRVVFVCVHDEGLQCVFSRCCESRGCIRRAICCAIVLLEHGEIASSDNALGSVVGLTRKGPLPLVDWVRGVVVVILLLGVGDFWEREEGGCDDSLLQCVRVVEQMGMR